MFHKQEVCIESKYKQQVQEIQTLPYEDQVRQFAPNYKHKDGRIYASREGEPYWVCTVSPYHKNFRSQIEGGVWNLVNELNKKNYMTVSSCEGHYFHDDCARVSLVFLTRIAAEEFVRSCSEVEGWKFKIEENERNVWKANSTSSGEIVDSISVKMKNEQLIELYERYNIIFYKKSNHYVFVDMFLFKFPESGLKRFFMKYILNKPTKQFFENRKKMEDYIERHLTTYEE